jgi:hypothetical protein
LKKRRNECVILIDDCLDSQTTAERLSDSGFIIERFIRHFPRRDDAERREAGVKDPSVLHLCERKGFLLFTADREMKYTHVEILKKTQIGVIATANNQSGTDVWINALVKAKTKVLREFKKHERPYFSILQKSGTLTTETITPERITRRMRPDEVDETVPTQPVALL